MRAFRKNQLLMSFHYTGFIIQSRPLVYLHPLKENFGLFQFLSDRHAESWAIITSEDLNSLEAELRLKEYVFFPCIGKFTLEERPAINGFFILNISLLEADRLANIARQEVVITGDVSGDAEVRWVRTAPRLGLAEMVLLTEVHGCVHRLDCPTGCVEKDMEKLRRARISPEMAGSIVSNWRENGIPSEVTSGRHPFIRLWMEDLHYKDMVIEKYRSSEIV